MGGASESPVRGRCQSGLGEGEKRGHTPEPYHSVCPRFCLDCGRVGPPEFERVGSPGATGSPVSGEVPGSLVGKWREWSLPQSDTNSVTDTPLVCPHLYNPARQLTPQQGNSVKQQGIQGVELLNSPS